MAPLPRAHLARAVPLLLLLLRAPPVSGNFRQSFCGTSWQDARESCRHSCVNGKDEECAELGEEYTCHSYTGCVGVATDASADKVEGAVPTWDDDDEGVTASASATANNFCGRSWNHANRFCGTACPEEWECTFPERCWAATNCDRPLEPLVSEIMSTMQGPDTTMGDAGVDVFRETMEELLAELAGEEGVNIGGVEVGDQKLVARRELQARYDQRALRGHDRYLNFQIHNATVTQRRLPSGSSAVDVSMVITGDYRPPPYLDLNVIAEDSINRNGPRVVNNLRERGRRAGVRFFNRVTGIEAVAIRDLTARPTRNPQREPTTMPTGDPVPAPSAVPSETPSSMPSSTPSRDLEQVLMTGSREDLMLGETTTSSYGFVFTARTRPDAGAITINRLDFYTKSTDDVHLELWTRMGDYEDHEGTFEGWDLIAQGTVKGRGIGRYTQIPEEIYEPVTIPGGGGAEGTRAFYMTLTTLELVYKIPEEQQGEAGLEAQAHAYTEEFQAHAYTEELEIWQGKGVLWYPWPDPQKTMYYRGPRQFLGAIYYDRLPCRPFSLYGRVDTLPCPLVPTGAPTLPPPTASPTTGHPTVAPTLKPTGMPTTGAPVEGMTPAPVNPTVSPTATPTASLRPTPGPTTAEPTFSPVVPMRANLVVTLRNVPEREMTPREGQKFREILVTFLKRHTGASMMLEGIDPWYQQLVTVDAKEGSWEVEGEEKEEAEEGTEKTLGKGTMQVARVGDRTTRKLPWKRKKRPVIIPQVGAMEVTLILRIWFSNLPLDLMGAMAAVSIREHEQELLALLHEQQAFYTFFKMTDGVACRVIEEVTYPPTMSPTTEKFYAAKLAAEAAALLAANATDLMEVDEGIAPGVFVGLMIGFLWCCLTAISVAYLLSARGEMEDQRDMENLLKTEKANALGDDKAKDDNNIDRTSPGRAEIARGDAECDHAKPGEERETSTTESDESSGARGDHRRSGVIRAVQTKVEIRDAHRGGGVGAIRVVGGRQGDAAAKLAAYDGQGDAVRRRGASTAAGKRHSQSVVEVRQEDDAAAKLAAYDTQEGDVRVRGASTAAGRRLAQSMIQPSSSEKRTNQKKGSNGRHLKASLGLPPSEERQQQFGKSSSMPSSYEKQMAARHPPEERMDQKVRASKTQGSDTNGKRHRSGNGRARYSASFSVAGGNSKGDSGIRNFSSSVGSNTSSVPDLGNSIDSSSILSVTDRVVTTWGVGKGRASTDYQKPTSGTSNNDRATADVGNLDALERDLARTNEKALKLSTNRKAVLSKGRRSMSMPPSQSSGDKRRDSHDDLRSSGSPKGCHSDDRRPSTKRSPVAAKGDHGNSFCVSNQPRNNRRHSGAKRHHSIHPAGNGNRKSTM